MGSDQSRSSRDSPDDQVARPPNYYEHLQVSEDATGDEIKVGNGQAEAGPILTCLIEIV